MKKFRKIFGAVLFFAIGIVIFVLISDTLRPITTDFGRRTFTGFYAEEKDSLSGQVLPAGRSRFYYLLCGTASFSDQQKCLFDPGGLGRPARGQEYRGDHHVFSREGSLRGRPRRS